MTKDQFMKKLYRLQVLQQMAVGIGGLTFKVDSFMTRDNQAAVEWMLLRGDEYLKSGTITEADDNAEAKQSISDLHDFISKRGWI